MLYVFLDTNIFRHDPDRKKVAFRALTKLANYEFVKIYVPYVVYKEFVSQEIKDRQDDLEKIINNTIRIIKEKSTRKCQTIFRKY